MEVQGGGSDTFHADEFVSRLDLAIDKVADWLEARLGDCDTGEGECSPQPAVCVGDLGAILASVACFSWDKSVVDSFENCDAVVATDPGFDQAVWPPAFTWTKPAVSQPMPGQTVQQSSSEVESVVEQRSFQEADQTESQSDDVGDCVEDLPIRLVARDEVTVDWDCDGETDLSLRFEQPNLFSLDWANEDWSDCAIELPLPLFRVFSDWLCDFAA